MPIFFAHDGTLLSYRATGEGDPDVCLPGGPMQDSSYLGDLGGVSGHRRLVVLELRGTAGHGSVYRHFPTKLALRRAVTERWLEQVIDPLAVITAAEGPALDRARRWFVTLNSTKRRLAEDDPDPFATYLDLLDDSPEMVDTHIGALLGQLEVIIRQGVDRERSAPTTRPPRLARCSTP
jgi:hypothetical protein